MYENPTFVSPNEIRAAVKVRFVVYRDIRFESALQRRKSALIPAVPMLRAASRTQRQQKAKYSNKVKANERRKVKEADNVVEPDPMAFNYAFKDQYEK